MKTLGKELRLLMRNVECENVKNQAYVLDSDKVYHNDSFRIAIVINLYYEEKMEKYLKYIVRLSDDKDVFLFTSNEIIEKKLVEKFLNNSNIFVKRKLNRGRDISALLVAFKPYINNYEYVCFLHDKKAKYEYLENDLTLWDENLWGNMIFSNEYIWSAVQLMNSSNYGILLPPKPIGQFMDSMYIGAWNDDFDNVIRLAEELQLNVDISKEDTSLVAIGSVFWCKVQALKKLFDYEWTYASFPEEPMPNDGTISHAIERIFGFVALDAGYKVGTIMNPEYVAKITEILQGKLELTYRWLWENLGVKNTYQLENINMEQRAISTIFEEHQEVYLYGAGLYGRKYLQRLEFWGYQPDGFVVSDGLKTQSDYCGYQMYELSELLQKKNNFGIIITANPDLQNEIGKTLEDRGIITYYKAIVI